MGYSIDPISADCYEGTTCLINKFGIKDEKKLSQRGELDDQTVIKIMKEEKPNQADRIRIPYNEIRQYIPRSVSYEKTADYIKSALIYY